MLQKAGTLISNNQRFIPLTATALLALVAYGLGAYFLDGMRNPQVFFNLFRNSPFLLISAIGMTLVILTGGIDLSVSGVVALTTVATAALLQAGWTPWVVILLMLVMGMALGAIMGSFITYMKVQPFIATLAGMWFARGMCFFISDDAIAIDNRLFRILGQTKLLIPGWTELATQRGDPAPYISIPVVVAFILFGVVIYVTQYTRFGRTVYAIGGNEGRNEQSARLMGLPVDTTKVLVYTFNGFCSALAGLSWSIYVSSGHGLYAQGFELEVIASVVMGGTMLSGGSGYVFGTLFGVLILGITQTLIQFNGTLSSWWTKIVIGLLTLVFIGVQSFLMTRKGGSGQTRRHHAPVNPLRNRRFLIPAGGVVLVIILAVFVISTLQKPTDSSVVAETAVCQLKPFRQEQATTLMLEGAILTYERNGGPNCIDELYAIYPDGRIVGDDGTTRIEKQVSPADLDALLAGINENGWFTDEMYSTWHTPCGQCYGYYLTVSYNGQEKTVKAVDGGTDAPASYWQVISLVKGVVPSFTSAP